jgi:hypothetical protein
MERRGPSVGADEVEAITECAKRALEVMDSRLIVGVKEPNGLDEILIVIVVR